MVSPEARNQTGARGILGSASGLTLTSHQSDRLRALTYDPYAGETSATITSGERSWRGFGG
eukprot:5193369-Alexandrium_andersonii.AAC.1